MTVLLLVAQLREEDAALMLGCVCISDLLSLIVPSLQPLATTQTDSTFLMQAQSCSGGAEGGARFHFAPLS